MSTFRLVPARGTAFVPLAAILSLAPCGASAAFADIAGQASPGSTSYPGGGLTFTADVQIPPGSAPTGSNKGLYSAAIDTSTGYALFGSISGPLTKVQLGTAAATPVVVGITGSLNDGFAGQNGNPISGFTNMFTYTTGPNLSDHYAWVGGNTGTGDGATSYLLKVQLFPGNNLQATPKIVSNITLPIPNSIAGSAVDVVHGYAYFAGFQSGTLVQLNLNDSSIKTVTGLPGNLNYWQMGLASNSLYISDSTQITRVKLDANGALPATLNASNLDSIAATNTATFYVDPNPAHPFAYTGSYVSDPAHLSTTAPATLTRYNIGGSTMSQGPTTSIQLPGTSFYASFGAIDPDSHLLLMGTDNALPGSVSKINGEAASGPALVGTLLLPEHAATAPWPYHDGDVNIRSAVLDPTTGYAYFGTDSGVSNSIGTRVVKVQYSQKGSIKGDKIFLPAGAALTSVNFYSHISAPASATSSGNLRLAIYTDVAGVPGTLLWQSAEIPDNVPDGGGWLSATLGLPTIATAGNYWLAWQVDTTLDVPGYDAGTPGDGFAFNQSYGDFPGAMPGSSGGLSLTSDNWSMNVQFVPEPASLWWIAAGAAMFLARRSNR